MYVNDIEAAGPDRRARRLLLDGCEVVTTAAAACKVLGLVPPCEVDPGLLRATELECAKERALRLLSYRERSCRELLKRLEQDGYPHDVAASVVDRLQELELVDDARFARLYVQTKSSAGYGVRRIAMELRRKGVPEDIVDTHASVLREDETERVRHAIRQGDTLNHESRQRAWRRLVAKGFDPAAVSAALNGGELDL